ncbi:lipid II flippase MurJ, partial [Salmonella enterica]|uniref:lipid II flippase MurJ n=1 Tax=Salmonella enterica TaxID=28901 RepID=UPI0035257E76
CNLILNLLLIGPFLHVGMALATGIAAWVQAGLLAWKLSQKSMIDLSKAFFQDVIYVILASICMAAVVYHIQLEVSLPSSSLKEAIYVFGLVGIGMAIYGIVYKMCLLSTARYKKTSV